ncbi:cytochrome c(L), periplasmic [Aurantimonas sp. 22II-16-19i]|uniref:cytochrome c(L), periplasmic n=1 Tax=Aurantimonas sp. 22II-16-19i TaxID=1317114 RepID=UPI0009F7C8E9|nr:cytochrome c(L), periplasmic [Aurantimonas sp. 22II-16-19i]ORE95184.1 cytochrome c, class I [Aurantimonas sp. 22II-16-19i]
MHKLKTLSAAVLVGMTTMSAFAAVQLYHTVEGTALDLSFASEEGRDTEAVKHFLATGEVIYTADASILKDGESLYLTACSGCHGHNGEGKIGPGLNDDYWTYAKNSTDKGLFETIYGGAQGMMGPQYGNLTLDEMLKVIAWVRHLYTGDPANAEWLTPEQRANFKPYDPKHGTN